MNRSSNPSAASANDTAVIRLHDVSKTYRSGACDFHALRNVDLEIAAGSFVALVGKSGSGKSTLLNMIGGIDEPSSGSVAVAGIDIQQLHAAQLCRWRGTTVGFVFQFFALLPTLTAAENVMLPMDFCRSFAARERRPRALQLLDEMGIAAHADKLPTALSGGEQQRVAIARALANRPAIVIADEPTGNLDSSTAASVLELFRRMANAGTTVVIATHERDIVRVVDRKIEMADGMLISTHQEQLSPATLEQRA